LHDFDVVIVGGGCSGLWAARTAVLAGARALLVERSERIGERIVCAEGLAADGIAQFTELGPECVAASIDRALLFDPKGSCVELAEPGCGYVLRKDVFLRSLAAMAASVGAEIRTGIEAHAVRPISGGGLVVHLGGGTDSVTAGAVVAADGIESGIGRGIGIQRPLRPIELFSCAQYRLAPVRTDACTVEFHFGRGIAPGGYAWVFPKGEDVANVGVGVICSDKGKRSTVGYLEAFRQRRCPGARVLSRVLGGVPSARSPFRPFGQGVFMAGDAARVADPMSGAGIVPGMESAELAAKAAVLYARCDSHGRTAEREFAGSMKALFKDRNLRFGVRKILARMSDEEIGNMLALVGEYASRTSVLKDPFSVVKFMVKAMPRAFGLVRHLVRT
jgi:digeranylgeranylglycerophospholipid reductase